MASIGLSAAVRNTRLACEKRFSRFVLNLDNIIVLMCQYNKRPAVIADITIPAGPSLVLNKTRMEEAIEAANRLGPLLSMSRRIGAIRTEIQEVIKPLTAGEIQRW